MRAEATAQAMRIEITGIGLGPYRDALECLLRSPVTSRSYPYSMKNRSRWVARSVIRTRGSRSEATTAAAGRAVAHTEARMCQSKLGIEFDRALEQRNTACATESRPARGTVRLQRFE